MDARFITSVASPKQLIEFDLPQVAVIGRSNCGKSTLLNKIMGRKNLVKTSSTPGHTQMINFFEWNQSIVFADLPGYGYAKAAGKVQKTWNKLMDSYLGSDLPELAMFLVDVRRQLQDYECQYVEEIGQKRPIIAVVTKTDKVSKQILRSASEHMQRELGQSCIATVSVSSLKNHGIDELRSLIVQTAIKKE